MTPSQLAVVLSSLFLGAGLFAQSNNGLIAHWPLAGDVRDHSGKNRHGQNHGAELNAVGPDGKRGSAAAFDGRRAWIEVPGDGLPLARRDFTIAVRVHTEKELDDVPGDILSQYDSVARRGVNFGILSLPGSSASQPNGTEWTDVGRLDHAPDVTYRRAWSMAVFNGRLFVGTLPEGKVHTIAAGRVATVDPWRR